MILLLLAYADADKHSAPDSAAADPTLSADIQPIFDLNCVSCHSGKDPSGELDLSEGMALVQLQQLSTQVSNMVRMEPGSLESSYIDYKINGTHKDVGGIGTMMPPQLALLDTDRAQVEAWILAGAAP